MKIKYLPITLFLILIIPIKAWPAGVVQYDTNTGNCLWVDLSTDEGKYVGLPDYMIFTDKTAMTVDKLTALLKTVEIIYLKKSGDPGVAEMSQAEKDAIDAKSQSDQNKVLGSQYKDFIENNLVIQTIIEEIANLTGSDPIKLRDAIEQSIATKLGIPNL